MVRCKLHNAGRYDERTDRGEGAALSLAATGNGRSNPARKARMTVYFSGKEAEPMSSAPADEGLDRPWTAPTSSASTNAATED